MNFIGQYGLFLAKSITIALTLLLTIAGITALIFRNRFDNIEHKLHIKKLNNQYTKMREMLAQKVLSKEKLKKYKKEEKKTLKKKGKDRARIFVLNFCGDIHASAVEALRKEITAILSGIATDQDEVVIRLESAGGTINGYGLAASQLQRIKAHNIRLTIIVDKVAASGGYLMACVADKILAAPFAIIGSIGVIAQLPNFHRFLKKHDIDFEQMTAGEYKRTLTMFGENTDKGREKFQEEIEIMHNTFKEFIYTYRPQLAIEKVSTGEYWLASQALQLQLIDHLTTSDDYLLEASKYKDIYEIRYIIPKSFFQKIIPIFQKVFFKNRLF